jgi:hypothetical protein
MDRTDENDSLWSDQLSRSAPPWWTSESAPAAQWHEHDLGGSAFQLILEHREISEAVCKRHDNLAVDDGGASIDLGGVGGFCGSVGPIIGRGG